MTDLKEQSAFFDAVNREIQVEFDKIWPREDWYPRKDDNGKMHGIAWGWSLQNGQLRLVVSDAGESAALFEAAICRALRRVATRVQKRALREHAKERGYCIICLKTPVVGSRSTCESCSKSANKIRPKDKYTLSECISDGLVDAGAAHKMVETVASHQAQGKTGFMAFFKNGMGPPLFGYELPFRGSERWRDSYIIQVVPDVAPDQLVAEAIRRAESI